MEKFLKFKTYFKSLLLKYIVKTELLFLQDATILRKGLIKVFEIL